MKDNLNRRDKVKLLNDLRAGKIDITDIVGKQYRLWFLDSGFFQEVTTGDRMSEQDFNNRVRSRFELVFIPADGCEPIE